MRLLGEKALRKGVRGAIADLRKGVARLEIDPYLLGVSKRTIEQITKEEKATLWMVLCKELGFDPEDISGHFVDEDIEEKCGEDDVIVTIYYTSFVDVDLRIEKFSDGRERWLLERVE